MSALSKNPYAASPAGERRFLPDTDSKLRSHFAAWLFGIMLGPVLLIVDIAVGEIMPPKLHAFAWLLSTVISLGSSSTAPVSILYRVIASLVALVLIPVAILTVFLVDLCLFGFDFDGVF